MNPKDCPLIAHKARLNELSADMVRTLRQLRIDLRQCDQCIIAPQDCLIRRDLNNAVSTAIQEVTEEWNLAAAIRTQE